MYPALFLAPIVLLGSPASLQAPAETSLEVKAESAVNLTKAMIAEILETQKQTISQFKAIPESDDIRMNFGKNMYGWSVSDKSLSTKKEDYEQILSTYQKDFKEIALIDELRLFAKKLVRNSQDNIPKGEARLTFGQKELKDGKMQDKDGHLVDISDAERKSQEGLLKILPLEIDYLKKVQKIASAYGAQIIKLMP